MKLYVKRTYDVRTLVYGCNKISNKNYRHSVAHTNTRQDDERLVIATQHKNTQMNKRGLSNENPIDSVQLIAKF